MIVAWIDSIKKILIEPFINQFNHGCYLPQVRGEVRLQVVAIPPDAELQSKQLQATLNAAPGEDNGRTGQGAGGSGKSRLEQLAQAKKRGPIKESKRGSSVDEDHNGSDVEDKQQQQQQQQSQGKFLRAMSRRPRVPPPPKVDYSQVQPKTVSQPRKVMMHLLPTTSVWGCGTAFPN